MSGVAGATLDDRWPHAFQPAERNSATEHCLPQVNVQGFTSDAAAPQHAHLSAPKALFATPTSPASEIEIER